MIQKTSLNGKEYFIVATRTFSCNTWSITYKSGRAQSGNLTPTEEKHEVALQAGNGRPLCTSFDEWQIVSLKAREVALVQP